LGLMANHHADVGSWLPDSEWISALRSTGRWQPFLVRLGDEGISPLEAA
jgi:hypothetical protein